MSDEGSFMQNYSPVFIGAVIIVIIYFLFRWFLSQEPKKLSFPPFIGKCPDYWKMIESPKGSTVCVNNNFYGKDLEGECSSGPLYNKKQNTYVSNYVKGGINFTEIDDGNKIVYQQTGDGKIVKELPMGNPPVQVFLDNTSSKEKCDFAKRCKVDWEGLDHIC